MAPRTKDNDVGLAPAAEPVGAGYDPTRLRGDHHRDDARPRCEGGASE
ncbi:MAG: hypothetical protein QOI12_3196 [Alphaproteobacteria bacterium]|jgi:hypothetical protein|nr:hypothetical protein [Alphaproteobacteria bacterium]